MLTKVRIVGSGLIGTSIGLGLVQAGVAVEMVDADPANQALAMDLVSGSQLSKPIFYILNTPQHRCKQPIYQKIYD